MPSSLVLLVNASAGCRHLDRASAPPRSDGLRGDAEFAIQLRPPARRRRSRSCRRIRRRRRASVSQSPSTAASTPIRGARPSTAPDIRRSAGGTDRSTARKPPRRGRRPSPALSAAARAIATSEPVAIRVTSRPPSVRAPHRRRARPDCRRVVSTERRQRLTRQAQHRRAGLGAQRRNPSLPRSRRRRPGRNTSRPGIARSAARCSTG